LQIQINREVNTSTLKNLKKKEGNKGNTVVKVLVPTDWVWSAATARAALLAGRMF
jgi:hypothetical protein